MRLMARIFGSREANANMISAWRKTEGHYIASAVCPACGKTTKVKSSFYMVGRLATNKCKCCGRQFKAIRPFPERNKIIDIGNMSLAEFYRVGRLLRDENICIIAPPLEKGK